MEKPLTSDTACLLSSVLGVNLCCQYREEGLNQSFKHQVDLGLVTKPTCLHKLKNNYSRY